MWSRHEWLKAAFRVCTRTGPVPVLLSRPGHVVGIQQPVLVPGTCDVPGVDVMHQWILPSSLLFLSVLCPSWGHRQAQSGLIKMRRFQEALGTFWTVGPPGFSSFIQGLLVGCTSPGQPRLRAPG